MSIIVNIYYTGENGSARKFAEEMEKRGINDKIRKEYGNIKYEYYLPMEEKETIISIDEWEDKEALEFHYKTKMMKETTKLRDKYKLKTKIERFEEYEERL